jgi:hypothetical protein
MFGSIVTSVPATRSVTSFPDLNDFAGALVTQNDVVLDDEVADAAVFPVVNVGATNTDVLYPDQHLPNLGLGRSHSCDSNFLISVSTSAYIDRCLFRKENVPTSAKGVDSVT